MTEDSGQEVLAPSDHRGVTEVVEQGHSDQPPISKSGVRSQSKHASSSLTHPGLAFGTLLLVPLLGTILSLIATRHGIGIGQDSAAYMGAADNLLHGRGITTPFDLSGSTLSPNQVFAVYGAVPLVHFPPLYPVFLATVSSTGLSIASGARWLNAILMGANLFVFELLVRRYATSRFLVPIAAALLLLAGPAVFFHENLLLIDEGAWSEPLFLFVFLLGILCIENYLHQATKGWLAGIAICVAMAPLIRYVGVSFVAAAGLVIFLWAPLPRRQRWWGAFLIVVCGIAPSVVWSLFTSLALHGGSARQFAWHPPSAPIHWLLYIGSGWILPGSVPNRLREALFLVMLLGAAVLLYMDRLRNKERRQQQGHAAVLAIVGGAYLVVVMVTLAFLDDTTPIDNRILCPLIPLVYLFLIKAISTIEMRSSNRNLLVAALCLIAASDAVAPTLSVIDHGTPAGNLLSTSATMRAVRHLPSQTIIATGVNTLLYTDTGRASIRVPVRVLQLTNRPNGAFTSQLRQLANILVTHHGVLVVLPAAWPDFVYRGATAADLSKVADLHVVRSFSDGGKFYRVTRVLPVTH
jgi:hypothetical protein